MAEESPPASSNPTNPPVNQDPLPIPMAPPLKQQIANEFKEMAQREPDKFGAFFQFFFPDPEGSKSVPQAIIEKAIDYQTKKDTDYHKFRMWIVWAMLIIVSLLVGTAITLVCLMRDHIDFVNKVVDAIGLIASHGIVGGGAWALGRAQSKSATTPPPKAPNISR